MCFSSEVKMELSQINNFSKRELLEAELTGYMLSANTSIKNNYIEFITKK